MKVLLIPLAISLVLLAACGGDKPSESSTAAPETGGSEAVSNSNSEAPASNGLPAGLFLASAPADPQNITAVKGKVAPGDAITLRGRIGGRGKPIVAGKAAFTIADGTAIAACDVRPDDMCSEPWDYCCEEPAAKLAATASVQVLDANGKVLDADLNGTNDIAPGVHVVVSGTVAEGSNETVLLVNASGIYVDTAAKPDVPEGLAAAEH